LAHHNRAFLCSSAQIKFLVKIAIPIRSGLSMTTELALSQF
jgi:hypothetical protein